MSDFLSNYKKCADLLTDNQNSNSYYASFKQLLYGCPGNANTEKTTYPNNNTERNHKEGFNEQNPVRNSQRTFSDNGFRVHGNQGSAERRSVSRRHQNKVEYSHFDELERLSSRLIRLLGEAKKEHGKLRNRIIPPRQRQCAMQQPWQRTHTNVCETQSNFAEVQAKADFAVSAASNMPLQSHGDRVEQVNQRRPLLMDIDSTTNSLSDDGSIFSNIQDDDYIDDDLSVITPSLVAIPSAVMGPQLGKNPVSSSDVWSSEMGTVQNALPTNLECNDRERKKKDNHNMIERRRRFNINDRIKELGALLPCEMNTRIRQNKGSVLKASVAYIMKLKKDIERFEKMEEMIKQNELHNQKLMSRVQKLEKMLKTKCFYKTLSDACISSENKNVSPEATSQESNTFLQGEASSTRRRTGYAQLNSNTTTAATSNLSIDDVMDVSSIFSTDSLFLSQTLSSGLDKEDINFIRKFRQNKGSVLKASIEYLKQLKEDKDRFDQLEEKLKQNELHYTNLMSRMQKLEILMKTECFTMISPNVVNGSYNVNNFSGENTDTASTNPNE